MSRTDEDARARALLDLARAEADLRLALLAKRTHGMDEVEAAGRALVEAREAYERASRAHRARARDGPAPDEPKSWGSH